MKKTVAVWIILGLALATAAHAQTAAVPSTEDIALVGQQPALPPEDPLPSIPAAVPADPGATPDTAPVVDSTPVTNLVTAAADDILTRIGDDPALYGARIAVYDSGFNPDTDSPDYNNFTTFINRGGDCMGMAFTAQQFYLNVTFDPSGKANPKKATKEFRAALLSCFVNYFGLHPHITVHGYDNLRDASKDPQISKTLHSLAAWSQLDNLSPELFKSLVAHDNWSREMGKLIENMGDKRPAILALDKPLHMGGHAILAYKVVEYEKRSLIFVYDSNAGPSSPDDPASYNAGDNDVSYRTVLVYDKATHKVGFHQVYKDILNYDYTNIVVFEPPRPEDLSENVVRVITKDIPKTIKHMIPVTPVEKAIALVRNAGSFIAHHLGLPF